MKVLAGLVPSGGSEGGTFPGLSPASEAASQLWVHNLQTPLSSFCLCLRTVFSGRVC